MKTSLFAMIVTTMATALAAAETANFDDMKAGVPPPGWTATQTGSGTAKWSVEKDASAPRYFRGFVLFSVETKSGRTWNACSMRPIVNGNAPPPCAKATRSFGNRSKTPPKIIEQMANDVSAGMPTSHGSQYFGMRSLPNMSHG